MQIQRNTAFNRIHVPPRLWGTAPGTDFWLIPSGEITTAGATGDLLSDNGWVTTSLVETAGSAADFLSSADTGVPTHLLTNASGDLLQSPSVFGTYDHGQVAAAILGYSPTTLNVEFWGAMTVHTADEANSGFGWVEAGGSPANTADAMAMINTDGTNFRISSGAASDLGAADDALWHQFKIVSTFGGTHEWFIDGTSQGTLAIQADLYPVSFGFHALTTNRPALGSVHIWYA